jgi:tRNA-(MS[2]IO[6]A)-hydroxylase MiaE-like protein
MAPEMKADSAAESPMAEAPERNAEPTEDSMFDQGGVLDLLGALAYGELSAFDRLAEDARTAPTLATRAALAKMAGAEIGHYRLLEEHLAGLGVAAEEVMAPFVEALDGYHRSTAPHDWLESLVKVYLGDGLAADFYREVAGFLPEQTRTLVLGVLADTGHGAFAEREVAAAIERNRQVRDRLALWGRRLLGEAITQAQHVVAERDELAELFVRGFGDLSGIAVLFKKLQLRHNRRMATLGLS